MIDPSGMLECVLKVMAAQEERANKIALAPLAALPEELILFQRVLTLLRGLCTQVRCGTTLCCCCSSCSSCSSCCCYCCVCFSLLACACAVRGCVRG